MTTHAYDAQGFGHGKLVVRISRPDIHSLSKVFASITEISNPTTPFVGDARMTVHNVTPHEGSVEVWVEIEWPNSLHYTINLFVVNV